MPWDSTLTIQVAASAATGFSAIFTGLSAVFIAKQAKIANHQLISSNESNANNSRQIQMIVTSLEEVAQSTLHSLNHASESMASNSKLMSTHASSLEARSAMSLRQLRADTILHCNIRYDDLYKSKIEIDELLKIYNNTESEKVGFGKRVSDGLMGTASISKPTTRGIIENKSDSYFQRFWGLKSDQFDYWLAGYVDPETIASWFNSILQSFIKGKSVGFSSYLSSWEKSRHSQMDVNPALTDLIDKIERISNSSYPDEPYVALLKALEEMEQSKGNMISLLAPITTERILMSKFISLRRTRGEVTTHNEDI